MALPAICSLVKSSQEDEARRVRWQSASAGVPLSTRAPPGIRHFFYALIVSLAVLLLRSFSLIVATQLSVVGGPAAVFTKSVYHVSHSRVDRWEAQLLGSVRAGSPILAPIWLHRFGRLDLARRRDIVGSFIVFWSDR